MSRMTRAPWSAQYIGIPWAERGYGHDGAHCWGLYWLVQFEQFNRTLPRYENDYADARDFIEVAALIDDRLPKHCIELSEDEATYGDGVIFKPRGHYHLGIVCGDREFLSVREGVNAGIERWNRLLWRTVQVGFFRWIE